MKLRFTTTKISRKNILLVDNNSHPVLDNSERAKMNFISICSVAIILPNVTQKATKKNDF